jgi:hypothetical protein
MPIAAPPLPQVPPAPQPPLPMTPPMIHTEPVVRIAPSRLPYLIIALIVVAAGVAIVFLAK